jgi:paraquat-inducible protein A
VTDRIACPSCDLLFAIGDLPDGGTAYCSRCGAFLTRRQDDAFERVRAYSTAALIMLAIACAFPFLRFSRAGIENTMTLPQTVLELWGNGRPWLALIVAAFIIVIPALVLVMTLALSTTLVRQASPVWLKGLARLLFQAKTWSMAEVFFIGVLVSLVKIMHMATVVIGISFWGYAAFTVLFVMTLTHLDRFQSWQRIEALLP